MNKKIIAVLILGLFIVFSTSPIICAEEKDASEISKEKTYIISKLNIISHEQKSVDDTNLDPPGPPDDDDDDDDDDDSSTSTTTASSQNRIVKSIIIRIMTRLKLRTNN